MSTAPTSLASKQPANLHGPWPALSPWVRLWPGPGRPASPATVIAVFAATLIAALSIPLDRAGLGWFVTALAGTAALVVARTVRSPDAVPALVERPVDVGTRDRFLWAAATVALLATGTFRAAGWLFALCLLTATLTTALALSSGRSLRSIAVTHVLAPAAATRGALWLARGAARLRGRGHNGAPVRVLATIAVSVLLLTVFGALFVSADAAFARIFEAAVPDLDVVTIGRWVFVSAVTAPLLTAAAFLRAAPPATGRLDRTEGRKVGRVEWAVPLGLLVLLFAAFVTVQLPVLFGGDQHVVETDGLAYAQYARSGFFELCAVTGLTLVVLAGAARWAPRTGQTDRILLRVVLGALATLTLVIVASALHRMDVYTDAYGLTRLRLLVACCEAWFGIVLVMVLVAGIRIRAPWLPRVAIAAGVLTLLGLAGANPDGLIAENHVQRTDRIDLGYLADLSPDAAPAIAGLDDPERRNCLLTAIGESMPADDWRGWNLARETARDLIAKYPANHPAGCGELIHRY
ncbi:DUF4173 domain-containing protein [Actinoplanes sp. NEAU-A12]|uniref:DUF4173 domain-containing protein n=1 Tax=Actinoplanes sandaracinus TaxID=3045177 RepID=A0ABT6WHH6_9ACTN|nr:DUF4173 domain-containing protein [Actinoplanes sandaracinus]MDI6099188.1 DUF4173 domain-containing protein [Actinoplanes sandaracinus]